MARPVEMTRRKDGPWCWVICACTFICNILAYGYISTYGIYFPDILKEFGTRRAIVALPGSIGISTPPLFGVFIGKLCDRYGCKKAMLTGCILCVFGLIVSSFVHSISILVITYGIVLGLGVSMVYFATMVVIPEYFNKYSFAATTIVSTGATTSLILMSPIVHQFNGSLGWRWSLRCVSSLSAVILVTALLLRSPIQTAPYEGRQSSTFCKLIDVSALRNKSFVLLTVVMFIFSVSHQMTFLHLAKFCDDLGISSELSPWLYFVIGLSSTFTRFFLGKFGKKGCLTLRNILLFGIVTLAVGNFLLPTVGRFDWLIVYCVNYGIGDGFVACVCINMSMECLPTHNRGGGYGLIQSFVGIGYSLGPFISGFIADVTGSYTYAFYTGGSLHIFTSILSLLFYTKTFRHQVVEENVLPVESVNQELVVEKETVL